MKIILFAFLSFLNIGHQTVLSSNPVLHVFCATDFVQLHISLDYNYFGVVYTLPNRDTCSTRGVGDTDVTFYVPLREPGRSKCGVIFVRYLSEFLGRCANFLVFYQKNGVYLAALVIRHHHLIETSNDYTFLVQCTEHLPMIPGKVSEIQMGLNLFDDNGVAKNAIVGHKYFLQVMMPKPNYEISSCVAFNAGADLRVYNLLDLNGCPIDETIISIFHQLADKRTYRAELTMFRFNGSHEFNIQCAVTKCQGPCRIRSCTVGQLFDSDLDSDSSASKVNDAVATLAATRLTVTDYSRANNVQRDAGCNYSGQPDLIGLSFLLTTLIVLTVISSIAAVANRPFRCHWHPRDSPIMEDIAKLGDDGGGTSKAASISPRHYIARSLASLTNCSKRSLEERNRDASVLRAVVADMMVSPRQDTTKSTVATVRSDVKSTPATVRSDQSTLKSVVKSSPVADDDVVTLSYRRPKSIYSIGTDRSTLKSVKSNLTLEGAATNDLCKSVGEEVFVKSNVVARNKSFLFAITERLANGKLWDTNRRSTVAAVRENTVDGDEIVWRQPNFYETPSKRFAWSLRDAAKGGGDDVDVTPTNGPGENFESGTRRTVSPLYINVDSSPSLVCPIDVRAKDRLSRRQNASNGSTYSKKWRI